MIRHKIPRSKYYKVKNQKLKGKSTSPSKISDEILQGKEFLIFNF